MPLQPGTKLGAYEIIEPIGAGGMGEVYRTREDRLGLSGLERVGWEAGIRAHSRRAAGELGCA